MSRPYLNSKGRESEELAARRLKSLGWSLVCQNKKIFGVEVDIIAERKGVYALFEVKSLSREVYAEKALKSRQKDRLKSAAQALSEKAPRGVSLFLALVSKNRKIRFVEITE